LVPRLLVATTNRNKVREIRQMLAGAPVEIVTLEPWPDLVAPDETGQTFEDNARLKALYYAEATGELTVAEDSGLSIDALDGAPGVASARLGGVDLAAKCGDEAGLGLGVGTHRLDPAHQVGLDLDGAGLRCPQGQG